MKRWMAAVIALLGVGCRNTSSSNPTANPSEAETRLSRIRDKNGGLLGTQLVTMGLSADSRRPYLVYCTFTYAGRPMPSTAEFDRFDAIQNRLDDLAAKGDFIQAGVMMVSGKRDYILYAHDGQAAMNLLHNQLGEFFPQMECQSDPKWSQYQDLVEMK